MDQKKELTKKIKCPMCRLYSEPFQYEEVSVAGNVVRLGLNICNKCGLHYVSPRLSDVGLKLLYDNSYMDDTVSGHYNTNEKVSHFEYRTFKKYVEKYSRGTTWKLLDVGCGVGNLLDMLKENKSLSSEGVEFSEFAFKEAVAKGHSVKKGDLLEIKYSEASFDCITIMYVLEHVSEPYNVIKKCYSLLRTGGYLMLAVPNLRYLNLVNRIKFLRFLTGRRKTLHPQEHLQNYSPVTIGKMVTAAGFSIEFRGMASPLRTGSFIVRIAKKIAWYPLVVLHRLGFSVGGIHLIVKKKG